MSRKMVLKNMRSRSHFWLKNLSVQPLFVFWDPVEKEEERGKWPFLCSKVLFIYCVEILIHFAVPSSNLLSSRQNLPKISTDWLTDLDCFLFLHVILVRWPGLWGREKSFTKRELPNSRICSPLICWSISTRNHNLLATCCFIECC